MPWQSLRVTLDASQAEAFSEALMSLGAISASLEDADAGSLDETPIFGEPTEPDAGLWQHCIVTALLGPDNQPADLIARAALATGLSKIPPWSVEAVDDQDWVRLTQSQFDPIPISPRLWIVPTWHEAPDSQALNIRLDPGLAFGTGSHPTTRLCLRWLDENIKGGETVLDYGCGSGILAIAAAKLGAGEVWGVDIDPQAIQAAAYNADMNAVSARFYTPDQAPDTAAQIVVANILTNPLKALAPLLASLTLPGGRLVMSGILEQQAESVMQVYRTWFEFEPPVAEEGWVRLCGLKKQT
jgi:ribosomal protein L11 methyltransferase